MRIPEKKIDGIFLSLFKVPITLIVVSVSIFGFLCTGIFHKGSMNVTSMRQEQRCCNLSSTHQFDSWQSITLVTPDNIRNSLILLILGLTLFFGYSSFSPWNRKSQFEPDIGHLYIKENSSFTLFNYLNLAFAHGILNPKIF